MRRLKLIAAGLVALLLGLRVDAAHLVRDINTLTTYSGTPASGWIQVGTYTLFLMDDGVHGQELWRTTGTPASTQLVLDINPGPASSSIANMTLLDGVLYFFADDGTNGPELWRSDGTSSGTHIVADIDPGAGGGVGVSVTNVPIASLNGVLYFIGYNATAGAQLWRSDGTSAGTYQVSNISQTGAAGDAPGVPIVAGTRVFFTASDSTAGNELWSSDGTVLGTQRVADINPGTATSDPQYLTATSAGVFFSADDGTHGRELWFATPDGTSARLVSDLSPGAAATRIDAMAVFGGDVIFGCEIANSAQQGSGLCRANTTSVQVLSQGDASLGELAEPSEGLAPFGGRLVYTPLNSSNGAYSEVWSTDGTPAGTLRLGASRSLETTSLIGYNLFAYTGSDGIYFFGYAGPPGSPIGLWRTDGTDAGTILYATFPQPLSNTDLTQYQGQIFLAAGRFSASGIELWATDGTPTGTRQVADLNPGAADSQPLSFGVSNGRLYFTATLPNGSAPWTSDGTAAGTIALSSTGGKAKTGDSFPEEITALGNLAIFVANDGVHGNAPWVSDGTAAGTTLLSSTTFTTAGPGAIVRVNNVVLFSEDDGVHGMELWASDGTPAGTHMVMDINPGAAASYPISSPMNVAVLNGVAYFNADDGVHGNELWRSNGTTAGTYLVADITPGSQGSGIQNLQVLNGKVIFQVNSGGGNYLWITDGTATGTQQVSSSVIVSSENSTVLNGMLYFGGQAPAPNLQLGQLWRTDGTTAGTQQVTDLAPGATYTAVDFLSALPTHVLFQFCAVSGPSSCTFYSTDSTAAGASQFSPDAPAVGAILGNKEVYTTQTATSSVLRVTDGTVQGTRDILSAPLANPLTLNSSSPVIQGAVVFTSFDPVLGPSVWRTDGTVAGTVLVAQINASTPSNHAPGGYTLVGNNIFFDAYEPQFGSELYVMGATGPNAADDYATAGFGAPLPIAVLANDGTMTGALDPSSISVTAQPTSGTVSVDPASGLVTYTPNPGFFGSDQFAYKVADTLGHVSDAAMVYVTAGEPVGAAPGTAPAPPPPITPPPTTTPPATPPPSSTPTSPTSSSNGGGGSEGLLDLVLLALMCGLTATERARLHDGPGYSDGMKRYRSAR